jgi:hypothetical protein
MYVDDTILGEAAHLLLGVISNGLPTEEAVESYGGDESDVELMDEALNSLTHSDLVHTLRVAVERLPEPDYDDEEKS